MKIKEVSLKTNLTQKAIRLYIENGLVHPYVETGLYKNSYTFTEENIRELEEVAVLRKAGFSILEISLMKEMPEKLPEILEKKKKSIEMEIDEKENMKEGLARLEVYEYGSVSKVADSLRWRVKKEEEQKESVSKRGVYIFITCLILFLFLFCLYAKYGIYIVKWMCSFLCFLVGLFSGVMTVRYAGCTKRANKFPNKGRGTVISVMEEHGFQAAFANAGSGSAGTKEPGIGGMWQIIFMLWNEIRPDCWFPVILYRNEKNEKESATLLYGSFKDVWHTGDEIAVSWDNKEPVIVYPLEDGWILKKIHFYFAVTVFSIVCCVALLYI